MKYDSQPKILGMIVRDASGAEKVSRFPKNFGRRINEADDLYMAFLSRHREELWDRREHFLAMSLSTRHSVISSSVVSIGTLNSSLVSPREVFRQAIVDGAYAVAFAHNHPSGDPEPSAEDIAVTQRLQRAADLLGIKFMDHLVISRDGYRSMREMDRYGEFPVRVFEGGAR